MYSYGELSKLRHACNLLRINLRFHLRCALGVKWHKRSLLCAECADHADDIISRVDRLGDRLDSVVRGWRDG